MLKSKNINVMKKSIFALAVIVVFALSSCADETVELNVSEVEDVQATEGDDPNENGGSKVGG